MVRVAPLKPDFAAAAGRDVSIARAALGVVRNAIDSRVNAIEYRAKVLDDPTAATVLRAASQPATVANSSWAGALAQTAIAVVASLTTQSAAADLLQRSLQLSFVGAAKIFVPGIFLPLADFVAEGAPIPAIRGTTSTQAAVEPTKFAAIVALSREMYDSPNAENVIRQAL